MATTTSTTTPTTTAASKADQETKLQATTRGTKNAFTGCFGFLQKTDEMAKIKFKQTQITNRKKLFGVQYFDLIEKGATEEELAKCVQTAKDDMKVFKDQIVELEKEMERVDLQTKSRMLPKPGETEQDEGKKEEEKIENQKKEETLAPAPAADSAAGTK